LTGEPLRILVVEDVPTDAELALRELKAGGLDFVSERVETREGFLEALERLRPDLVLSDFSLPRFDGMQALRLLLERDPLVPFIVITGATNEATAVECMKAGAADYVIKDHLGRLAPAVRAALEKRRALERQRQAEAALRESEASFSAIFNSSPVGIMLSRTADGQIVNVNQAFLDIVGGRREDLVGRTTVDLGMWAGGHDRERFIGDLQEGGGAWQGERSGNEPLGKASAVLLTTKQIGLAGGSHLLTMVTDISERKRTEEDLRRIVAILDVTQQISRVGGWELDLEHRTGYWTDEFYRIHGLERGDLTLGHGGHVERSLECYEPEDRPRIEAAIRACVEEGRDYDFELPFTTAKGERRRVRALGRAIREGGRIVRVVGTLQDVTEKGLAEERLRMLSRMVEQSPVCALLTDPEGYIEYANPKFYALTGYTPDEVLGRNPRILQSGLTPRATYETMWATIKAGGEWSGEFCNRKKSGELYWEFATIGALRDAQGRVTHLLAVKEDITAQKLTEAALRKSQEQLLQSQKMEAVGRLAGGGAHDFNNLLSVIRGYSEIALRRLPPGDPACKTHEVVLQAADRAAALTRQLLAFSRKQVLELKVVDLGAALAEMEKMLRRLIGEDVELRVERPARLGRVRIDPGQFEQVVMNLAVNSRDAMPGGGTLLLQLADVELDDRDARDEATVVAGPYVMLTVSDTGTGMDPETRGRVFEPFFTTKERGHGTGLGLSTVYGIVKQSGGYIWVDSEPGRGSTFRIYLPRVDAPVESRVAVSAAPAERGLGETVLVVEDDPLVLDLSRQIIAEHGYRVLTARDGHEALRVAAESATEIALLLTDVILPGLNGRQLAEELRRGRPRLRVLYMSGYTDDVIARAGVHDGRGGLEPGVRLLQKPFTMAALLTAVQRALRD
jgi:two-component system, cell cycle sensor histidine kinase and response regulator CckA